MQAKHLPLGRPEAERLKCRYDQLGLGFNKGQRESTLEVVQGRVELSSFPDPPLPSPVHDRRI